MKKNFTLLILGVLATSHSFGQFRVGNGTRLNSSSNTVIATNGNITNQSTDTDLSRTHLFLLGNAQVLNTSNPVNIGNMTVNNNGNASISGEWVITTALELTNGILTPTGTGKLIYTGSSILNGSENSHVNGFFYSQGTGTRSFPIGNNGFYAPTEILSGAPATLGMRLLDGDAGLTLPVDVTEVLASHYWELVSDNTDLSASVALSTNNLGALDGAENLVVVHGDPNSSDGTNLGGVNTGAFINSQRGAPMGLLTIGRGEKINLVIHDMITPFNKDGVNDVLLIDNIELTESNKVSLLDRYGSVVKEWIDYSIDPGSTVPFDFSQLTPGNYICVVEYTLIGGSGTTEISQMVTILQTN